MRLGVVNCDEKLLEEFPKSYEMVYIEDKEKLPTIDALLVDWLPRYLQDKDRLEKQATIVDVYCNQQKKKPSIVLFDRYLDIIEREYNYLKKFNTFFFEPAVNNREGFRFLPPWTKCYDLVELPTFGSKKERKIDLGHIGSLKNRLKSFEKYYVEFASFYPKFNVHYKTSLPKSKISEYKDAGVTKKDFGYADIKVNILIDTPRNYEIGYLNPDIFNIIEMGCYPLIPKEHRFYQSVFTIIDEAKYIPFYIGTYNKVKEVMMLEIYDNIKNYFPEMMIENTVDTLKKCLEENV